MQANPTLHIDAHLSYRLKRLSLSVVNVFNERSFIKRDGRSLLAFQRGVVLVFEHSECPDLSR